MATEGCRELLTSLAEHYEKSRNFLSQLENHLTDSRLVPEPLQPDVEVGEKELDAAQDGIIVGVSHVTNAAQVDAVEEGPHFSASCSKPSGLQVQVATLVSRNVTPQEVPQEPQQVEQRRVSVLSLRADALGRLDALGRETSIAGRHRSLPRRAVSFYHAGSSSPTAALQTTTAIMRQGPRQHRAVRIQQLQQLGHPASYARRLSASNLGPPGAAVRRKSLEQPQALPSIPPDVLQAFQDLIGAESPAREGTLPGIQSRSTAAARVQPNSHGQIGSKHNSQSLHLQQPAAQDRTTPLRATTPSDALSSNSTPLNPLPPDSIIPPLGRDMQGRRLFVTRHASISNQLGLTGQHPTPTPGSPLQPISPSLASTSLPAVRKTVPRRASFTVSQSHNISRSSIFRLAPSPPSIMGAAGVAASSGGGPTAVRSQALSWAPPPLLVLDELEIIGSVASPLYGSALDSLLLPSDQVAVAASGVGAPAVTDGSAPLTPRTHPASGVLSPAASLTSANALTGGSNGLTSSPQPSGSLSHLHLSVTPVRVRSVYLTPTPPAQSPTSAAWDQRPRQSSLRSIPAVGVCGAAGMAAAECP